MSAVAVIRWPGCLVFAGDGVAYRDDGRVDQFPSKLDLYPHLHCVIGFSGLAALAPILRSHIDASGILTFDQLVSGFPDLFMTAFRGGLWHFSLPADHPHAVATAVLGGWSEASQDFGLYRISATGRDRVDVTTGDAVQPIAAGVLEPIESVYCTAAPPADQRERFGQLESPLDAAAFLVAACRQNSGVLEGGPFAVGGFLQMVVLERHKVASWIAHRWPDRPGELVDPTAGEPFPAFPIAVP